MSNEMDPVRKNQSPGERAEIEPRYEGLGYAPRVVIYGQSGPFYTGSKEVTELVRDTLISRGLPIEGILASRDAGYIQEAFYEGDRAPQYSQPEAKGRFQRLLGSLSLKRRGVESSPSSEVSAEPADTIHIPTAVFVLPLMRAYDDEYARTIDTPVNIIEELCRRHQVPMILVSDKDTPESIQQAVGELPALSSKDSELD